MKHQVLFFELQSPIGEHSTHYTSCPIVVVLFNLLLEMDNEVYTLPKGNNTELELAK